MGIKVITTLLSTALQNYDLTTIDEVKDELSILDNSKDATLKRYITSASAAASQYCNRKFQAEQLQDEFWPDREPFQYTLPGGVDVLQLSRWPVIAPIISVVENGIALVENTDFRVNYDTGTLIRLDSLNFYPRKWAAWPIVAKFVGGFADIPEDIEDAIIRMVTRRYASKGRDPNLKQQSIPGVIEQQFWISTGTESGNFANDIADVLNSYRVPVSV
ncbi:Phage gp6-like head-tail connector protein [Bradyrhizobium lablabi]|uniref:Phage gp6-like head-tail connector protein n=1 Tax=Bradyrhizobium lablabi TaxID=722472 RepID=A0A1M6LGP8_9BRAD|nr:phage head-tail connector protein [Bradyrhizobium lablabi]SHJ70356.1 Phage gp6-like head-tail connector protein [Bradyrhizobium lablabi]